MRAAILYMPVIHRGYLNFIESLADIDRVFVISSSIALDLQPSLRKDIRALGSNEMADILAGSALVSCPVSEFTDISEIADYSELVMPDEEISHDFALKYLAGFDTDFVSVFLRWDKKRSTQENEVVESFAVSRLDFDRKIIEACRQEARKSGDWWRQVGGCVVKNGVVVLPAIHNIHVPNTNQPYFNGDPRSDFSAGKNIELGTALHVELSLIATAAEIGVSLAGAHLYVTTFPCPWCAKAIAYSGIERVYFEEGYAVLDAQTILEDNGIELVRIVK